MKAYEKYTRELRKMLSELSNIQNRLGSDDELTESSKEFVFWQINKVQFQLSVCICSIVAKLNKTKKA